MESLAGSKVWADYNAAQADRPVRSLCLDAMALAGPGIGRQAIDLGCGAGKETLAMLRAGWNVHAVDSLPDTTERLLGIAPAEADGRLSIEVRAFQDLRVLPPRSSSSPATRCPSSTRTGSAGSGPWCWMPSGARALWP